MNPTGPENPFAPPKSDLTVAPVGGTGADADLATRWQRFGGSFVDGLVTWIGIGPAYLGISFAAAAQPDRTIKNPFFIYMEAGSWGHLAAVLTVLVTGLQWFLIVKRGQSLGKMAAGTRIVMLDGTHAGFVPALALRTFPLWMVNLLAGAFMAIGALGLIDILLIFRRDRRCLHDLIAGTKVIKARGKP